MSANPISSQYRIKIRSLSVKQALQLSPDPLHKPCGVAAAGKTCLTSDGSRVVQLAFWRCITHKC